jgi:serine/threonine-protein kinase
MAATAVDRNALLGALALQTGLLASEDLDATIGGRLPGGTTGLGETLVTSGAITVGQLAALDALVDELLVVHGDAERGLSTLRTRSADPAAVDRLREASMVALAATSPPGVDENATRYFEGTNAPSPGAHPAIAPDAEPETRDRSSGRFHRLRLHAKGGLGAVFLAYDTQLRREVALKEIQDRHADRPDSRARFLREAELTGGLEHPGVVPVHALGRYPDGRPYYAMRFIRGESLKEAIAQFHDQAMARTVGERSLRLRQLLGRFLDVCNAIQYAHSKGVLHRDLKPGNIMLGPFGETLVVDWGLAKPIGQPEARPDGLREATPRRSGDGTEETLPGVTVGTPQYMSPEQAEGRLDLQGPASDVYSLGATLYSLLIGKPPFEDRDVETILHKVIKGDFPAPRAVAPDVPRPLDAICRKAMATRPEDRYTSAQALAEDIERWLADEPVLAWREPSLVRARRWLGRNRTMVVAAVASIAMAQVGLAVVAGVKTAANRQLQAALDREAKAKESAQERFLTAMDAVRAFHEGASEDVLLKEKALEGLRRRLLDTALSFYTRIQGELERDPSPVARAALADAYDRLASLTAEVSSKENALKPLGRSLAIREALADAQPDDPLRRVELASTLLQLGRIQHHTGRHDAARRSMERSLAIRRALVSEFPANDDFRAGVSTGERALATLRSETGHKDEALPLYRSALASAVALARAHPDGLAYRRDLATSHDVLGRLLSELGRPGDALHYYREALRVREDLARTRSDSPELRGELATSFTALGNLEAEVGRQRDALGSYRKALQIEEAITREFPISTRFRLDLANAHLNMGRMLTQLGAPDESLREHREAIAILETLAGANSTDLDVHGRLARAHISLGTALYNSGRDDEALKALGRGIAVLSPLVRANPAVTELRSDLALACENRGAIARQSGRPAEALAAFRGASESFEALARANPGVAYYRGNLAFNLNNIGSTLAALDRPDEARLAIERARGILEDLCRANPTVAMYKDQLARGYVDLGKVLERLGRPAEALASLRRGLGIQEIRDDSGAFAAYNLACTRARCASLVGRGHAELTPQEQSERRAFSDGAMEALRRAVDGGFRNAAHIARDSDLVPLHDRPDFQALLRELGFPADPFAP